MKKQISGKIFTGSADNEMGTPSLAMSIDDCEGVDELKQLYRQDGRELLEEIINNFSLTADAYFAFDGEVWQFEGSLDCSCSDIELSSFEQV